MQTGGNRSPHRADYILERGVWKATCRECGWKVADTHRRQAATQFRVHIQDMRNAVIDLRDRALAGLEAESSIVNAPSGLHPSVIRVERALQTDPSS